MSELWRTNSAAATSYAAEYSRPVTDESQESEARDRCLTEFFGEIDKKQRLKEALAALLHDLFRARLEEIVKGMPLSDGGLRLTAEVAARVAVLCRTNFEFLESPEQERARADADRLLKALAETR